MSSFHVNIIFDSNIYSVFTAYDILIILNFYIGKEHDKHQNESLQFLHTDYTNYSFAFAGLVQLHSFVKQ